jgi:hypothetical protein
MQKQTKHNKKRALSKKQRKTAHKRGGSGKRGGGCGCQNNVLMNPGSLFSGGNAVVLGNAQDLAQLSDKNYYPLNTENANPNYSVIASRQTDNFLVKGGKKQRNKSITRKSITSGKSKTRGGKKTRGGSNILNNALSYTMVGANEYPGLNNSNNFFSQPYERYTVENPPRA